MWSQNICFVFKNIMVTILCNILLLFFFSQQNFVFLDQHLPFPQALFSPSSGNHHSSLEFNEFIF